MYLVHSTVVYQSNTASIEEIHFCNGEGGVDAHPKGQEYNGEEEQHDDADHRIKEDLCCV